MLEVDQDDLRAKLNWCCRASHEHQLRFLVTSKDQLTRVVTICQHDKLIANAFSQSPTISLLPQ